MFHEHFAWSARRDLDAPVVLESMDEDAALDALAEPPEGRSDSLIGPNCRVCIALAGTAVERTVDERSEESWKTVTRRCQLCTERAALQVVYAACRCKLLQSTYLQSNMHIST